MGVVGSSLELVPSEGPCDGEHRLEGVVTVAMVGREESGGGACGGRILQALAADGTRPRRGSRT